MDLSEMYENIYPVRVDCLVDTYAGIAEQAFGNFLDQNFDPDTAGGFDRDDRRRVSGIKTIVFAAMAIEAAAFEFSASILGDTIAEKYLDRMDIVGKWMIGPRLVCGQSLDAEGPAITSLKGLVSARNALVHHKSKPGDKAGKAMKAMMDKWAKFEKDQVPNAFKTLVLLSLELKALPSGFVGVVPYRDRSLLIPPGFRNDYSPHPRVKKVIDRCHEIHKKHLKGV